MSPRRVFVLTVSDTAAVDSSLDQSGPVIRDLISESEWNQKFLVTGHRIVPDEKQRIVDCLISTLSQDQCDWVISCGGTGFGPRDVTPEAVSSLIERPAPGLIHLMMAGSLKHTPLGALSRPVAGTIGNVLVITLPGSPKAAREILDATFLRVVHHALELLRGGRDEAVHLALGLPARPVNVIDRNVGGQDTETSPSLVHRLHSSNESIKLDDIGVRIAPLDGDRNLDHTCDCAPVTGISRPRHSPYPMISFDKALEIALRRCSPLEIVEMVVDQNLPGHVLAEDVFATENIPLMPTTNVDGYALQSNQQPGTYAVVTPSTHPVSHRLDIGTVMQVNTGSPIPYGTDAVIMVEDTSLESSLPESSEEVTITTLTCVKAGDNVRQPGSDVRKGEKILELGEVIDYSGGEMGTLAFVGRRKVKVFRKPRIGLLSTGNELVDLHDTPTPQSLAGTPWTGIRDSNRPSLRTAMEGLGYQVIDLGIARDTFKDHLGAVASAMPGVDILVVTGGTSMGTTDLLKPLLEEHLSGSIHFGRIAIKPGKPTTFATIPVANEHLEQSPTLPWSPTLSETSSGSSSQPRDLARRRTKPVFALPGNPASALVMFWTLVLPALRRLGGFPRERCSLPRFKVQLDEDMLLDPRPEFHRVVIRCTASGLKAFSTGGQRSSRAGSLSAANGFICLPARTTFTDRLSKGSQADAILFGELRL